MGHIVSLKRFYFNFSEERNTKPILLLEHHPEKHRKIHPAAISLLSNAWTPLSKAFLYDPECCTVLNVRYFRCGDLSCLVSVGIHPNISISIFIHSFFFHLISDFFFFFVVVCSVVVTCSITSKPWWRQVLTHRCTVWLMLNTWPGSWSDLLSWITAKRVESRFDIWKVSPCVRRGTRDGNTAQSRMKRDVWSPEVQFTRSQNKPGGAADKQHSGVNVCFSCLNPGLSGKLHWYWEDYPDEIKQTQLKLNCRGLGSIMDTQPPLQTHDGISVITSFM